MIKDNERQLRQLLFVFDLAIVLVSFFISYFIRNVALASSADLVRIYPIRVYISLIPLLLTIWGLVLYFCGAYESYRMRGIGNILKDIAKASIISQIIFASAAYLLKYQFLSRSYIVLIFLFSWALMSIQRVALVAYVHRLRRGGKNFRYLLLVGTGRRAQHFIQMVQGQPEWGLKVIGLIDDDPALKGTKIMGYEVIGTLKEMPKILQENIVDEVFFVVPRSWLVEKIEDSLLYCEQLGKRVSIAVDLFSMKFAKAIPTDIHGLPILMFQSTPDKIWPLFVKRTLDIIISAATLVILSPFLLLLTVLIKMTSSGPVFFRQKRCSLNGRVFTIYKFRTMIANAEKMQKALEQYNEMGGPAFKMDKDPRVTPLGRWIRKFSLDEFPQFWNVLKGDMSVVGPRPPIPSEVENYETWQRRRLSMRPGLTCIWQVEGRNKITDFDEWMHLDMQYIDTWSLWLDLKIFIKTIPVVLFGIGAK